jgi:hypothetical protein
MSSAGFGTLRQKHPADLPLLDKLESELREIALQNGVMDERSLAQTLGADRDRIENYLVELSAYGTLTVVLFWLCPHTGGTAWFGDDLVTAPTWISCPECNTEHFFSERDVEVHFVAPSTLQLTRSHETR